MGSRAVVEEVCQRCFVRRGPREDLRGKKGWGLNWKGRETNSLIEEL